MTKKCVALVVLNPNELNPFNVNYDACGRLVDTNGSQICLYSFPALQSTLQLLAKSTKRNIFFLNESKHQQHDPTDYNSGDMWLALSKQLT